MKNFIEFRNETEIIKTLEQIRWGNKTECPHCGGCKIVNYTIENKFQCENCFRSFSVFSKTEFENTKLPLSTWLLAYYLIKDNASIDPTILNKWLNVTQKTSVTIHDKIVKIINENNWFNKISESNYYKGQFSDLPNN